MEMPPGPPQLGAPAPPPAPAPSAEGEVVEADEAPDRHLVDEAANRRLVATTAAIALVSVAIMIIVFLLTQDPADEEPEAGVAPPVTVAPPTTAAPQPQIDPAELEALVAEISAFVEVERELEFEEDVDVLVVDRTEYERRFGDVFDADLEVLTPYLTQHAAVYQALGLWLAGDDPVSMLRDFSLEGSLGFYDPRGDELVIAALQISPLLETTLAHELAHALDDQHFDLDRIDLLERSDERNVAFSALVEGDARRIEEAYTATLSDDERTAATEEGQELVADFDPESFPPILLYEQQVTYTDGQSFVQAVFEDGGNRAVNDAFREPPTTTEEIQEPDTFLQGIPPALVPAPEADGDAIAEGVVGQATFDLLASFERPIDEPVAEWNGDHYVLWADDEDGLCLRVLLAGDVSGYEEQLGEWAGRREAEVTTVDDRLQVTVCG